MKHRFLISLQYGVILFLLLKLSVSGFAQPENKISASDRSIQQLLDWRIVGPLKDTLEHVFDLASPGHNALGTRQGVTDTIYHQENEQIDLSALFKTSEKGVGYAICKVFLDNDQEMRFFVNVDDAIRLWINDRQVLLVPELTRNRRVVVKVHLNKGVNTLIAEIKNTSDYWGFDIDIATNNARGMPSTFSSLPVPENSIKEVQKSKVQLRNWRITGPFITTLDIIDYSQLDYLRSIPENTRQNIIDTVYRQEKEEGDLNSLLGADRKGVAYAICDVVSDEDQDLVLWVNMNNEMRLWVNDSLVWSVRRLPGGPVLLKKVHLKKGVNRFITEIKNITEVWWFNMTTSAYGYGRNNALLSGFNVSSQKFIIPEGDSLSLEVADPDFMPVKNSCTVKIFDARNRNCYTGQIDIKKHSKFALPNLAAGAYRFDLYTDLDTLNDFFCYGALDKIYNKEMKLYCLI
jgi:hypothetical protein